MINFIKERYYDAVFVGRELRDYASYFYENYGGLKRDSRQLKKVWNKYAHYELLFFALGYTVSTGASLLLFDHDFSVYSVLAGTSIVYGVLAITYFRAKVSKKIDGGFTVGQTSKDTKLTAGVTGNVTGAHTEDIQFSASLFFLA
ncbi:hypothetical protein N9W79_01485, partial [bacterium]|nr:hypothetical protein [bacterium]